ncbi:MAG: TOMM precursor leader peptide-binding protein [Actinomycetes bacterium]
MLIPELADLQRPQWRSHVPALWRDNATIQLGDDVIIDRVSPEQVEWLRRLDGSHTGEQLGAELTFSLTDARRLVRCLRAAGAVIDAATVPQALRFTAAEARDALVRRWDAAVDQHRDPVRAIQMIDARDRLRVAIIGEGELRDALARALEAAGLTEVATTASAGCVVLADAHHPDVPAHLDATYLDIPHLHVGVRGDRGIVGPMVVPGVTGCLRCAHLHRRDRDRAWSLLAVQWSQAGASTADPLVVILAAAHAAQLVRTWVDEPRDPQRWADLAVELRLSWLQGQVVSRPPHPLCGCRWPAA